MQDFDVAIVGAGLAGSLAAAMLGRTGYRTVLMDPHTAYPTDFRCEKLDAAQIAVLQKTGLASVVVRAATRSNNLWIARLGHLVEKRPYDQLDILYQDLVNSIRSAIPDNVSFMHGKTTEVSLSKDRQLVKLSNGEVLSARLVVLASGLNNGLRHRLGITREITSASHSISIGFDLQPLGRPAFEFPALTYFSEGPKTRVAYLTLFPVGSSMRANLFVYRDLHDPWLRHLRQAPREALDAMMPRLQRLLGKFEVAGFINIRPVDLYVVKGHRRAGVALVGDAFSTSCPAAGTGVLKVLTDVERLCNKYVPQWLATPGMSEEKINAYYNDKTKAACDEFSTDKAYALRALSINDGLLWHTYRHLRFLAHWGVGALRHKAPSMADWLFAQYRKRGARTA